jgi:hypothetical protein
VRVRVERKERAGHASQQRHHHEPMRWERRLLVLSVYCICGMAVAFTLPCAARLHAYRPRNGSPQQYIHIQSVQRRLRVLLPPYSTTSTVLALHYSLLRSGQKHHTRLYHGWPARVATCALLARLPAQRYADLNSAIISYPEVISQTSCLLEPPYNKSLRPGLGPRGSPLLVLLCSWRLLGASLDLAFARVIDIQCIRPRHPQQ